MGRHKFIFKGHILFAYNFSVSFGKSIFSLLSPHDEFPVRTEALLPMPASALEVGEKSNIPSSGSHYFHSWYNLVASDSTNRGRIEGHTSRKVGKTG